MLCVYSKNGRKRKNGEKTGCERKRQREKEEAREREQESEQEREETTNGAHARERERKRERRRESARENVSEKGRAARKMSARGVRGWCAQERKRTGERQGE